MWKFFMTPVMSALYIYTLTIGDESAARVIHGFFKIGHVPDRR